MQRPLCCEIWLAQGAFFHDVTQMGRGEGNRKPQRRPVFLGSQRNTKKAGRMGEAVRGKSNEGRRRKRSVSPRRLNAGEHWLSRLQK